MADIRDAFGEFVIAQWPAADSFNDPPPFVWPDSPVPVIIDCWKRFRTAVLEEGKNGGREALVEPAKWVKFLCSAVRRADFETQRYSPWLHKLGVEMCGARMRWTIKFWWTCRNEDRAWARTLNPNVGARPGLTIEPPEHYTPADLVEMPAGLPPGLQLISQAAEKHAKEPLAPKQMAQIKRLSGVRSGIVTVTADANGKRLPKPTKRLAWISWPKALDHPQLWATARAQVGQVRPVI